MFGLAAPMFCLKKILNTVKDREKWHNQAFSHWLAGLCVFIFMCELHVDVHYIYAYITCSLFSYVLCEMKIA